MAPRRESVPAPPSQDGPGSARTRRLAAGALLAVLTLAAYLPALGGGFVWDDDSLLTENPNMRTVGGLWRTWFDPTSNEDYYPLTHTSWWIEYRLWGLRPLGYHLSNVILHAANAVLVWLILGRLGVPGAWVAAAVFAVHPVHVESVAWVAERKNVLSGLLFLLAMGSFLRFALAEGDPPDRRRWQFYGLSLILFVLALLAKPVTMTLAAALPLVVWWKRGRLTARDVLATLPYLAIAAPMTLLTMWVQRHHVGAFGATFEHTVLERCLIAGRVLVFYAGKLLWPVHPTFAYPKWDIDAGLWWQYLFPAGAAAAVAALAVLRRRLGGGPLLAVLFFIVTLAPALGFVDIYWHRYYFVADHIVYLASLGLTALGAAVAVGAARRAGVWGRRFGPGAAAAVLAVLGILTWQQCHIYKDSETLWTDTLAKNPASWMAHNNLGRVLAARQELDKAIHHYHEALRLWPGCPEAHVSLGIALLTKGKHSEAAAEFQEAARLNPRFGAAHNNLGLVLATQGRVAEAIDHYRQALGFHPLYVQARINLAIALISQGKTDEAIEHFREALRIEPEAAAAHYNLGVALAGRGSLEEATAHFRETLRLQPRSAAMHIGVARSLWEHGDAQGAVIAYRDAIRLAPDRPDALNHLAWILATDPDPAVRSGTEAVRLAERAVALTGRKDPSCLDTLAAAHAEAGQFLEAAAAAHEAAALATGRGLRELAAQIRTRLDLYQSGKPYREPAPAPRETPAKGESQRG